MKKGISIIIVLILFIICFAGAKDSENKVNTSPKYTQEEIEELMKNSKESGSVEMEIDENQIEINDKTTFQEFN